MDMLIRSLEGDDFHIFFDFFPQQKHMQVNLRSLFGFGRLKLNQTCAFKTIGTFIIIKMY